MSSASQLLPTRYEDPAWRTACLSNYDFFEPNCNLAIALAEAGHIYIALVAIASGLEHTYQELGRRNPTHTDIASLAIAPPVIFDFAILQIYCDVIDLLELQSRFCERMVESRDHYTASIVVLP